MKEYINYRFVGRLLFNITSCILNSEGDVTITGEGMQNVGLSCLVHMNYGFLAGMDLCLV